MNIQLVQGDKGDKVVKKKLERKQVQFARFKETEDLEYRNTSEQ